MDEKNVADAQEIQDENLEGATGGSVEIICEMGAKDEEDAMLPNPFTCPLCRKPVHLCHCHD